SGFIMKNIYWIAFFLLALVNQAQAKMLSDENFNKIINILEKHELSEDQKIQLHKICRIKSKRTVHSALQPKNSPIKRFKHDIQDPKPAPIPEYAQAIAHMPKGSGKAYGSPKKKGPFGEEDLAY